MAKKYNSVQGKLRKGGGKGLSGDALVGKVSQKTIDSIKKLGMTEALKLAGKNGATAGGAAREFQEGVRRMYGAKRLATAKATYAPKPKLGAKTVMAPKGGVKPAAKPAAKPASKRGQSTSDKLKIVGGTVAGIGLLALGKGKGASAAAKLSPAVGKLTKSSVGKALFGTGEKLTNKALVTSGKVAAKTKKSVSQSQFDAMTAAAKAKGIKLPSLAKSAAKPKVKASTADAARAAGTVSKKKVVKAGMASSGAAQTKK